MENNKKTRNILWYFIRSKVWQEYLKSCTHNYEFLAQHDPERAALLLSRNVHHQKGPLKNGVRVFDYIYDMYDCVHGTRKLSEKTKARIWVEIDDLLIWHTEMGTIDEVV